MGFNHDLLSFIPAVPDFPKSGIVFRDIAPLLADAQAFRHALDLMAAACEHWPYDYFAGIESRGLIFAAALGSDRSGYFTGAQGRKAARCNSL